MRLVLALCFSLFSGFFAPAILAQDITLNADVGEYLSDDNRVELRGNVRVERGTMLLRADRVTALLQNGEPETIEATGSVRLTHGENDARTEKLTYDVPSGKITMGDGTKNTGTGKGGVSFKLKADSLGKGGF